MHQAHAMPPWAVASAWKKAKTLPGRPCLVGRKGRETKRRPYAVAGASETAERQVNLHAEDDDSMADILNVLEDQVTVCFAVKKSCSFGMSVAILGNTSSLGEWDPKRAVELIWTEDDLWVLPPCKAPRMIRGQSIEYKYVVVPSEGEDLTDLQWQEGDNNIVLLSRKCSGPAGTGPSGGEDTSTVTVLDSWDTPVKDVVDISCSGALPKSIPVECFLCGKCHSPHMHLKGCPLRDQIDIGQIDRMLHP